MHLCNGFDRYWFTQRSQLRNREKWDFKINMAVGCVWWRRCLTRWQVIHREEMRLRAGRSRKTHLCFTQTETGQIENMYELSVRACVTLAWPGGKVGRHESQCVSSQAFSLRLAGFITATNRWPDKSSYFILPLLFLLPPCVISLKPPGSSFPGLDALVL